MSCPCGSQRRAGQEVIDYLDEAALRALVPSLDYDSWTPLLSILLGTPVNTDILCQSPPPAPRQPTADDFDGPIAASLYVLELVNAVRWPLLCECIACPPITTCGGGPSFTLTFEDGYYESAECWAHKFHLVDASVYMQTEGCVCAGPFEGDVFIQWNPPQSYTIDNPRYPDVGPEIIGGCGGVTEWTVELSGSGAGQYQICNTHDAPGAVTIWQNGAGAEPNYPWPELPVTVEPFPAQPTCTEEAQCEAIDYLTRTVTELIWQTALIAQRSRQTADDVSSIVGPYSITIPGLSGPIEGNLADVLPKLFVALAPPSQDQLTAEWTEVVGSNNTLDVTGLSVLVCHLTDVPPHYNTYGEQQEVYWNTGAKPAPARVSLLTSDGVLSRHQIDNVETTVIPIHPLVVAAAVDVGLGVEVTVTGLSRAV